MKFCSFQKYTWNLCISEYFCEMKFLNLIADVVSLNDKQNTLIFSTFILSHTHFKSKLELVSMECLSTIDMYYSSFLLY